jgi:tetratricopeptide (TPR) repeat protein
MRPSRTEWIILGVVVAARVAALVSLELTTYADFPLVDAQTYWQQATTLLEGRDPFSEGLYQPPGYPAVLAAFGWLSGELTMAAIRRLQLVLGCLTSLGLLVLGRRLGSRLGAPWAGAAAVLLFSLYPTTLLFEGDLLTPALTNAALVGALLCLLNTHWWRAPFAGALMGLAVVCHPTYLFAAGWLAAWRGMMPDGRRALAGFTVAFALSLSPTVVRNYQDFGAFTPVSHNAGLNLYLGNNPGWRGTSSMRAGLEFRQLALEAEPHRRDTAERNKYWRDRAITGIIEHPDAWAAAVATKAVWSVNNTEIPRNEDYRCRIEEPSLQWLGWLPVRYGWVFPFALLGAAGAIRRRDREGVALAGAWVALHLPMVLFLVADRYRLATWPLICLLAPLGAVVLRDLVRARSPWLLGVLVAAAIPWASIDEVTDKDPAWCRHVQGNLAYMVGERDEAMRLYQESLALDGDNMSARTYVASMLTAAGEHRRAAEQMDEVLREFPEHFPSLRLMSSIEQRLGDRDAAADYMGRAYRVPGKRQSTGVKYVELLVEAGRIDEARAIVRDDEDLQRSRKVRQALSNGR